MKKDKKEKVRVSVYFEKRISEELRKEAELLSISKNTLMKQILSKAVNTKSF